MSVHRSARRRFPLGRMAAGLLLAVLVGCAGRAAPGATAPAQDACVLGGTGRSVAGAAAGHPPLVVGVSTPVAPGDAPVPWNPAERLVFAQLYQTLVRVDCRGEARPLLARSWTVAEGGRRWTFHLRPGIRTWTGAAVGAEAVMQSWLSGPGAADVGALSVVDDTTLRVDLPRAVAPAFFARPELAVTLPGRPGDWPPGTGPFRPAASAAASLVLLPMVGDHVRQSLEFRTIAGDPRNALDGGVDLLVTRDREAVEYAAASGGYRPVPLPWDRVYLLALPGRPPGSGAPTAVELQVLARDAVRVDARAASATPAQLVACADSLPHETAGAAAPDGEPVPAAAAPAGRSGAARAGTAASRQARIVYPRDDAAAAGLAQRLVALARMGGAGAWPAGMLAGGGADVAASGLPDPAFRDALRGGDAAAFVVPLEERAASGTCALLAEARRRAPWLRPSGLVPLVETRATAIVREGVYGVSVDGAGTLLLGAARAEARP